MNHQSFTGQVIDVYRFKGQLQVTLWSPAQSRKRTVELADVSETIMIGDVVHIHGGVGSDATILGARDVPDDFAPPMGLPERMESVELILPRAAAGRDT